MSRMSNVVQQAIRSSSKMIEDSDLERSRSPKRRRISGNDNRYSSPDELAASSDHEVTYHQRTNSIPHRDPGEQHQRRSYADSSEDSPDELDHTIHTFYRDGWNRSQRHSRDAPSIEMITPRVVTPPVEQPSYLRYKQKMVLKGHRRGVAAVRISPDGRSIASCCECTFFAQLPMGQWLTLYDQRLTLR